jgi:hypothetical protein
MAREQENYRHSSTPILLAYFDELHWSNLQELLDFEIGGWEMLNNTYFVW